MIFRTSNGRATLAAARFVSCTPDAPGVGHPGHWPDIPRNRTISTFTRDHLAAGRRLWPLLRESEPR